MARARNIKPAIMANEDLADLEPIARLLFIYLWMLADREGRMEDRPRRIKAEALPYDDCDIESLLDGLVMKGFIVRYSVDGEAIIQVTNFNKHQAPHIREKASDLPEIPDSENEINAASINNDANQELASDSGKSEARHNLGSAKASPRSPDVLIPDSLIPDCGYKHTDASASECENEESLFDQAWSAYPKRAGGNPKVKARQAWNARVKEGVDPDDMLDGVYRYAKFCQAEKIEKSRYVLQASTFFGPALRFQDDYSLPARPDKPKNNADRNADWNARLAQMISGTLDTPQHKEIDMGVIHAAH